MILFDYRRVRSEHREFVGVRNSFHAIPPCCTRRFLTSPVISCPNRFPCGFSASASEIMCRYVSAFGFRSSGRTPRGCRVLERFPDLTPCLCRVAYPPPQVSKCTERFPREFSCPYWTLRVCKCPNRFPHDNLGLQFPTLRVCMCSVPFSRDSTWLGKEHRTVRVCCC